ncbi:MAG TPA: hypothetical protein VH081_03410 [Solirubrobacteraceae bacterium]|jgi:Tol biopolymer transport system component|nr:hypothetical protein [Solirubrobacteraceae bacterium]
MRRALAAAAALLALIACASARADVFGTITLASRSADEQADYAHDPAISADGGYVAFDGSFGGETGVFRRNLASGAVEAVAAGAAGTQAGSAELPSISANGQYVSFTTTAQLVSGDINAGPDVYVANMSAAGEESRYALASAVDGTTEEALSYESSDASSYGSVAAGRSALSADGTEVAFVTTAVSNLAGPQTPALQVAVRNLLTDQTQLVSVALAGGPVSASAGATRYGAVYSPSGSPPTFPYQSRAYAIPSFVGASISGDGSTVAWLGQDVAAQAPMLPGETAPNYTEPLWRRIAPAGPTRRVTGGSDPFAPGCAASGQTILPTEAPASNPCQGPLLTLSESTNPGTWEGHVGDPIPQLSANGMVVGFIAQAEPLGNGTGFSDDLYNELYVANMSEGLTRVQASRQLTELGSGDANDPATTSPVIDLAVSPDGTQVAFATRRTIFPLGSPGYVTAPAAVPGMVELFDVDLGNDTLTRVSQGFDGEASEHPHGEESSSLDPYSPTDGALSPSFSGDGDTLAFSSTASNLVFGDGNTPQLPDSQTFDGSDVFVVPRVVFTPQPTPQMISPPPSAPALAPVWQLGASALSRSNGTVLLEVTVPGAGTLRASARSAVRVTARAHRHGKRASRANSAVQTLAVASASRSAREATQLLTLALELGKRYRALATRSGGLSSAITLTFQAAGHRTLRQTLDVTFQGKVARKHATSKTSGKKGRRK